MKNKTKITGILLFAFTASAVAFYPELEKAASAHLLPPIVGANPPGISPIIPPIVDPVQNERKRIEVVFVMDTTGSMSGLIQAAKEKVWSIASSMAQAESAPEIRMGLVAYRDRGDDYVTRTYDLSADLDSMYANLMDFRANGGGDGPESVNQGLYDAIHKISWSQDQGAYQVVFLVGDAPPHMDYQDDVKYPVTLAAAKKRGIVVNAIQCGTDRSTRKGWQQIAQLGQGDYFQVDQAGSTVAISTPYDDKLASLSKKLDDTRLYYGDKNEKAQKAAKVASTEKLHAGASVESRARRAVFNASKSGESNLIGDKDLVSDIASGKVELDDISKEMLPEPIQAMAPAEQEARIKEIAQEREELQQKIGSLAKERSDYLKQKVGDDAQVKDSLDEKIYASVRAQAEKKGLRYEAEAAAY